MEKKTEEAIKALKSGELAILPTETVYGLFADAMNQKAVEKLYAVKGRPTDKALNLNVSSYETILKFSKNQPDYLEKLVKNFLPGPLTIILEAAENVPAWVHIGKKTIGFRMPSIAVTQEVIRALGVLVGPSANLTGAASPRFFSDLTTEILENAAVSLKDDSIYGLDTTILDLTRKQAKILRQGAITAEELGAKVPELGAIEQ
ncbi:L-threonylcarbamoyladenylate synthase [Lactococcus nasutitermitis]|uniref:L-threonylcarbamoyladenylate synthase n=1 Tax=Lactococcus nasutitermitis TaxID=1652957 RepID=A0ABV9J9U3_9LACT|nr:L-threonylcarbamoyladenylate synthase [Lactococcus nasutitermitis]